MDRTQQIKEAHPWLSYDDSQGSSLSSSGFNVDVEIA